MFTRFLFAARGLLILAVFLACGLADRVQAQCGPGQSLNFNGGHAVITNLPDFGANFSVEAWVYPTGSGYRTIISRGGGNDLSNRTDFIVSVGPEGFVEVFARGFWDLGTPRITNNTWTHLAVVVRPDRRQLYINGVQAWDWAGHPYQPSPTGQQVYLGRQGSDCNCNFFSGAIDEVRFWSIALTSEEVAARWNRALSGSETNVTGYYRFDEASGVGLLDDTGGDSNGTLTGAVTRGASGAALQFETPDFSSVEIIRRYPGGVTLRALVNPRACDATAFFRWGQTTQYGATGGFTVIPRSSASGSIEFTLPELPPGEYHAQLAASNSAGLSLSPDQSFTVDSSVPQLGALTVTKARPGADSVSLTGQAEPGGWAAGVWFEWGLEEQFNLRTEAVSLARDTSKTRVTALLTNLAEGTYGVRLAGTNGLGTNYSSPQLFTIAYVPEVTLSLRSSLIDKTPVLAVDETPVLTAQVDAGGSDAQAWFEWGQNGTFNFRSTPTNFAARTTNHAMSTRLPGLAPGQWQARVIATNGSGTGIASDTFTLGPFFATASGMSVVAPSIERSSLIAADVQGDGFMDLSALTEGPLTEVWTNSPSGFVKMEIGLPRLQYGSLAWNDLDHDGDLDVVINGHDGSTNFHGQAWLNDGEMFRLRQTNLLTTYNGYMDFGDYDNDGQADLLIAGGDNRHVETRLWSNAGNGSFAAAPLPVRQMSFGHVAWADFNNDGRDDFVICGATSNGLSVAEIWFNIGSTFVREQSLGTSPLESLAVADINSDGLLDLLTVAANSGPDIWQQSPGGGFHRVPFGDRFYSEINTAIGDYDNDGLTDVLISGQLVSGTYATYLYRNTGSGFERIEAGLPHSVAVLPVFADFDNDGRLDFISGGPFPSGGGSTLYRNRLPATNAPPSAPRGLAITQPSGETVFSWQPSSDDHTPAAGLSYNLRVGTTPGGVDIISPMSDVVTGRRFLPARGNADLRLYSRLRGLKPGHTYYWSVQAVDTGYAGGAWASEQVFTLEPNLLFTHIERQPTGAILLRLRTPFGLTTIEASSNLVHWTPLGNVTTNFVPATFDFLDTNPAAPRRFYRARPE